MALKDEMEAAARNAAKLNIERDDNVAVELAPSPRDPANQAVNVTITTQNTLYLAPILGIEPATLSIGAESFASFGVPESGCIVAFDETGTGIKLSGGVRVEGGCFRVSSNAGISASCGISGKAYGIKAGSGSIKFADATANSSLPRQRQY